MFGAEDLVMSILLVPVVCFALLYSGRWLPVLGTQWFLPHIGSLIFLGSYLVLLEGLDIDKGRLEKPSHLTLVSGRPAGFPQNNDLRRDSNSSYP